MDVVFFELNGILTAIYSALSAVVVWSTTHGVHIFDWYITFLELWCGVMIGGILLSFVVYDDDGATDVED